MRGEPRGCYSGRGLYAFISYLGRMIEPLIEMTNQLNQLQQAMVAGERVFALLDETRESTEGELRPLEGRVSFERVSFSYDGEQQVLREVSFAAKPGQMLALVGHTGSGKSTIISLLMGFYPLDQGQIRFDDHALDTLSLAAVRRSIGLVQQDPFIFVGTLAENLRLGRAGIDETRLWQALSEVQLAEFVRSLPQGINTLMEEGARTSPPVSGNCSPLPARWWGIRVSSFWMKRRRVWTPRPSWRCRRRSLPPVVAAPPSPSPTASRPSSMRTRSCCSPAVR